MAVPTGFICPSCDCFMENTEHVLIAQCSQCGIPMSRQFAHHVHVEAHTTASLSGKVFVPGSKKWIIHLKSFQSLFRREGIMAHVMQIVNRRTSPDLYRKTVILESGRVVKDVEGLARDPLLHGEQRRKLHPSSPKCSDCAYYALSQCTMHNRKFCTNHRRHHANSYRTDSFIEIEDDRLW